MFTPIPYFNNYYRIIGIIIILTGILITLFPVEYSEFNEWLILIGLFTIAYTKENNKNPELQKKYKYNSLRISFALIFLIIIINTFSNLIRELSNDMNMIYFGILYLFLYFIIYYIHIIFKIQKLEPDRNLKENYKQNKILYIVTYTIAALLILFIIIKLV